MACNRCQLSFLVQVYLVANKDVDEVLATFYINHSLELLDFFCSLIVIFGYINHVDGAVSFSENFSGKRSILSSLKPYLQ